MKNRIKVEVPLSGSMNGFVVKDSLTVSPPCFYCGKPVDTDSDYYYTYEDEYQIKYWGRGRKFGSPMLGDVVDPEGKKLKGKYILKLPYCPEHVRPVKAFKTIDTASFYIGLILGAVLTFYAYREGIEGGGLLAILIGAPLLSVGVLYFIGVGIKAFITIIKPELKDYALRLGHFGIQQYGVRIDGGKPMVGPITYTLTLAFSDPKCAHRFLESNPHAKVTKGKALLAEESGAQ